MGRTSSSVVTERPRDAWFTSFLIALQLCSQNGNIVFLIHRFGGTLGVIVWELHFHRYKSDRQTNGDRRTDAQNYDSQDPDSIAASRGINRFLWIQCFENGHPSYQLLWNLNTIQESVWSTIRSERNSKIFPTMGHYSLLKTGIFSVFWDHFLFKAC